MNYKMVVFDLDGTMLNDSKEIDNYTIKYLNELYEKGIEIIIATGRNYYEAKELTKHLKFNKIIMANNGCMVRNSLNDQILCEKYLNYNTFYNIYTEGKKLGLHPIIHVNEYFNNYDIVLEYNVNNEKYLGYMENKERRFRIKDFNNNFDKILSVCYLGEYETLKNFEKSMIDKYSNTFNSTCASNFSRRSLLEFLNENGCKWKAIIEYAKTKDIEKNEIITIGDDNNDLEMIINSGLGIAMKNGAERVKKCADIITTYDNNESGAIKELKKIFT